MVARIEAALEAERVRGILIGRLVIDQRHDALLVVLAAVITARRDAFAVVPAPDDLAADVSLSAAGDRLVGLTALVARRTTHVQAADALRVDRRTG
jgi:hypothetical protein